MTVTFLLFAGIVPGRRNCLQVIEEIQAIRSPRSVFGLRSTFTTRLPGWNLLQAAGGLSPMSAGLGAKGFSSGPGAALAGDANDNAMTNPALAFTRSSNGRLRSSPGCFNSGATVQPIEFARSTSAAASEWQSSGGGWARPRARLSRTAKATTVILVGGTPYSNYRNGMRVPLEAVIA